MRLINVETLRLETFVGDNIPPYAILSHTWGADEDEVSFENIQRGNIEKPGNGTKKLKGCCNQAKREHLKWVWIDTCCIDKQSSSELEEAINSMFQWYKKASVCYAYLSDVPHEDDSCDRGSKFFSSRWFQRGWTLQELLAPREMRFYNREWTQIGTRADMSNAIEAITGISWKFLRGWEDFRQASVAQRMSWAAKRKTSRKEDTAYCLLGIFDVTMPMIYGEGNRALSRLQQEIMKNTGDHSLLAWGLDTAEYTPSKSASVISAGILATAPSDFANCRRIVLRKQDATPVNTFDISGGRLRIHLPLHTTSAGETYGLLNCGPEHNADQVVGIPIHKAVSSAEPDEYLRPQGRYSVLLQRTAPGISTKHIQIQMERQSWAHEAVGRRLWLHIDAHQKTKMKLEEEYPPVRWENGRALIVEASDSDGHITGRCLARFRTHGEGSRDVIVVLEFELHGLQPRARYHVMTLSRDTALEDLSQNLIYMRPEALGKQAVSIGNLHVEVTVEEEQVAQEPMLIVRLAPASSSLEVPVDANLELYQVNLKLEFVRILQEEDRVHLEMEELAQQRDKEMAALNQKRERLAAIEGHLRKLREDQRALSDGVKKGAQQVDQLTNRLNEARQQQDDRSGRESEIQRRLDELETKRGPGNWLETLVKTLLNAGNINGGLKEEGDSDSDCPQLSKAGESRHNIGGQTPLQWAAMNGHKAIAKLLLEKGANLEAKDKDVVRKLFGLNPEFVDETDQEINPNGQPKTKAEFVANVRKVFEGTPAERFFKNNPKFIAELAEKAASLADDPNTPICNKDLFPKTAQVTLHQQVLYCDDSGSMKREGRWDSQNLLINRIAQVTTRILPEGEGVYLRYINQQIPNSDSLKFEQLRDMIESLKWGGDTPIGTNLKSKVLQPLVYDKLPDKLERPLLVSVITDGMPEPEPRSTFVDAIVECGDRLEAANLPRESVKFMVGQVGTNTRASQFLQDIADESRIANVVFVASEKLDAASSKLETDWKMDEWLIETLYGPIMKSEGKKNK